MVWGKPLHAKPLLMVAASEEEGRVSELWDLDSLARVLEVRDKSLYADFLGPLQRNEWLVASLDGGCLAWLTPEGDVHV